MQKLKQLIAYEYYLPVYGSIVLIINLFLYSLPLVGVLGYEFSVVNGLLLYLVSGTYTIFLIRRNKEQKEVKKLLKPIGLFVLITFLIPFIIINTKTLLGSGCSFTSGLSFYFVITLPSLFIGIVVGLISNFLLNRFQYLFFILITLVILSIPLIEIYYYPQVYFFNPIIGFFPGTIFDEAVSVSLKLIVYRLINLIYFIFIGCWILKILLNQAAGSKASIVAVIFFPALTFFLISPAQGFSTDLIRIKDHLNKTVTTDHFVIHYSDQIEKEKVELAAILHEYYYKELAEFLQCTPSNRITTFLFDNAAQKKELFGSANADVAKPWLYQAYLSFDSYTNTLKHELAHCFTAEFGTGIFKLADWLNPSLIEGIASASEPYYDDNFITYMAALANHNEYRIDLTKLYSSLNFFGQTASLSYIYSGAFSYFLIEKYGIQKFKELYADLDFEKIYQKNLNELQKEFYEYLSLISADNKKSADYYFGRKSIIYKVCPRYIGVKLDDAWSLYQNKKFADAGNIFNEILTYGENYSAIIGLSYVFDELNRLPDAVRILKEYQEKFKGTTYYYNLQFRLADVLAVTQNFDEAKSVYQNIYSSKANKSLTNLCAIRLRLMDENLLIQYLEGSDYDKLSLLKRLNSQGYFYESWSVMIDLSEKLEEHVDLFTSEINKTIQVTDLISSYAVFKLSEYLIRQGDFFKAKKMAGLALRYTSDENFNHILEENFKLINWLNINSKSYINNFKFE
ncbi:MAG: hypothetical protein IPM56_09820 [Ignavibacteriales bacterium]|nr:MAG: hypothetical protein IPM56_09820 [Ignavibacteriales bacterium]